MKRYRSDNSEGCGGVVGTGVGHCKQTHCNGVVGRPRAEGATKNKVNWHLLPCGAIRLYWGSARSNPVVVYPSKSAAASLVKQTIATTIQKSARHSPTVCS